MKLELTKGQIKFLLHALDALGIRPFVYEIQEETSSRHRQALLWKACNQILIKAELSKDESIEKRVES